MMKHKDMLEGRNAAPSATRTTTSRGRRAPKGVARRLVKTLFEFYPVLLPITLVCILINALVSSVPAVFLQKVIAMVDESYKSGDWSAVSGKILSLVGVLVAMYVISLIAGALYTQMMAIITQGSLKKMRQKMFDHMQDLPIRYFDTNGHGDIMSYYTNDVDTLRQLISQSLPNILISAITLFVVFCIMVYYSVILALVVVAGVVCMVFAARAITKRSSTFFLRQQITLANAEAFMEEMMTGQKVIKVFCHEEAAKADFDKVNDEIFFNARNGNRFANILMPLLGNIGNVMYVVVALVGGALLLSGAPNLSLSGMAFSISIVVPFLNMTKQFAGSIGQVSNQINMVIMGLAGAHRIFTLLDEKPETDDGYVTLVNAKENADGTLTECPERTMVWAWNIPITTAPSPTPGSPATCGSTTWTLATHRTRSSSTTSPSTPSPVRRSPSSAPPVPVRRRSPTSSTASTTSTTARSATTASTSTRSRRPTCGIPWAWCCRTRTCSPALSWRTSATATWRLMTKSASQQPSWPAPTTSSAVCPRATTPCSAATAQHAI